MTTASDEILARYTRIEREADALGRMVAVRRLRASQQLRIGELTDAKDDTSRAIFSVAASVCEIEGNAVMFPRNRGDLDAIIDRLDNEGMEAASKALGRLYGGVEGSSDLTSGEAAKNS